MVVFLVDDVGVFDAFGVVVVVVVVVVVEVGVVGTVVVGSGGAVEGGGGVGVMIADESDATVEW